MKTKFVLAATAVTAAMALNANHIFLINKNNGLQTKITDTQLTVTPGTVPTLGSTGIALTDILDIRRQASADFAVKAYNVTSHSFTLDMAPADNSRYYVAVLMEKAKYDACKNRTDVHFYIWDPWRAWAELDGIAVEKWVENNGVLRTGKMDGVVASGLKADTDYVLAVYYTDSQGHDVGSVHTVEVRTLPVEQAAVTFNIEVNVKGKILNTRIEPSNPNQIYWHGALSLDEVTTYGKGDLRKAVEEYLKTWREFIGRKPEDFLPLIASKGTDNGFLDNLNVYTDYVYVACALDRGMNLVSDVASVPFSTKGIVPSDNKIDVTIPFAGTRRALVDIKTSNREPYIVKLMTDAEVGGRTAQAIIDSLALVSTPGDLFNLNRRNGDVQIYRDGLKPGARYWVLSFGYLSESLSTTANAQVTTKPQLMSFVTPSTPGGPESLGFYFMTQPDDNRGASALAAPSEDNMPFYFGYSRHSDPALIRAEIEANALAAGQDIETYLQAGSSTAMTVKALYLPEYAQRGTIAVEKGDYYVYAVALFSDGMPVDKIWVCQQKLQVGTRPTLAPARRPQHNTFQWSYPLNKTATQQFINPINQSAK